jgi:Uma2 family endonuclease
MIKMTEIRQDRYTYADYEKWPEGERWELIAGRAYALAPAPYLIHQQVSSALHYIFYNFFKGKPCQALFAPVDVRLPSGDEPDELIDTVVQPDLLVVCDSSKLDKKGVRGAPDLVVEILSGSTAQRDLEEKLSLYEKHGIRCYIIADPWGKTLTVRYRESSGLYGRPEFFSAGDRAPIRTFEGLFIDLVEVFERTQQ